MMFRKQNAWLSGKQAPLSRFVLRSLATALAVILSACGGSAHIPATTASGPQLYMTPVIAGAAGSVTANPATYTIDDKALTFAQQTYVLGSENTGALVNYSGDLAFPRLARGLQELELTYVCGRVGGPCSGITYNPPQAGSGWAVELANQGGGLLQLTGEPFVPLVPAVTCPSMTKPETFLYVTLPSRLITTGTDLNTWNPQIETAYGSVDISAKGSSVSLANIKQYLLPSAGGGTPATAPSSTVTGACSPTAYGNTIAVPPTPTVTIPVGGGDAVVSRQATIGIGPSGLLVEDNGSTTQNGPAPPHYPPPYYQNALGAGSGAIGLPKPSSALDTTSLVNAQYLGFFYGSGSSDSPTNWSSLVASFGFPNPSSSCQTLMAQIAALTTTPLANPIYGGDFPVNTTTGLPDPSLPSVQSNGGYGNCDFAIDLGAQDAATNGLYPSATVYVGSGFSTNTTGKTYSFPAVAIAGQLGGRNAIFLLGGDLIGSPNQAWGIYLLQSN